ncbi:MAG TPA: RIP metalloprotease RseP [bacterium (Candidatus Stahlbacteria)]|nr:RIP metalloprotease RseP [Candidatus Stahlbacteria bacterium]
MLQLIVTVIILGVAILIHELGHLLAALLSGIPVERFSIGFGPMIIKRKIKGIDFGIGPIPLGGYVKIRGKNGIFNEEPKRRFPVLFMGPIFNILSAPIIIVFIFVLFGLKVTPTRKVVVDQGTAIEAGMATGDEILAIDGEEVNYWEDISIKLFTPGSKMIRFKRADEIREVRLTGDSLGIEPLIPPVIGMVRKDGPADRAGIRDGDLIVRVDGNPVTTWDGMAEIIRSRPGEEINLEIRRDQEIIDIVVTPDLVRLPDQTIGQIGVMTQFKTINLNGVEAISIGLDRFKNLFLFTGSFLIRLITMRESVRNLGGPVAIARVSSESLSWGLDTLLFFLAFIMINLGIINLVPIPILDGGHIILSLFELVRKKRVSRNFLLVWQQIGVSIFIILAILVTFNDLTR